MPHEPAGNSRSELIERELRSLRVLDPTPSLRGRVIQAVGAAAAGRSARTPGPRGRGSWIVEGVLAACVILVVCLTGLVDSRADSAHGAWATGQPAAYRDCLALGIESGDVECRRLLAANRAPANSVVWLRHQAAERAAIGELQ